MNPPNNLIQSNSPKKAKQRIVIDYLYIKW